MSTIHSARRSRRSLLNPWTVAIASTIVALSIGVATVANNASSGDRDGAAVVETGEINSMGMPIIATPGAATGTAAAGTVEVTGANWELGRVPLNTAVRPSWLLLNTGTEPVTIGEPHPEVRDGCCPGAFTIDTATIPPGGEAMLTFELSMHPGMDGWHDIAVHVPIQSAVGQDALTLGVTGDFRDA